MRHFIVAGVVLLTLSEICVGQHDLETCIPRDTCSCENIEGIIDLHPLARKDGTPRFRDIPDKDGKAFYSWNPCYNFQEGTCQNVAACRMTDHGRTCTSLGPQSSMQSVSDSEYGLLFRYTNPVKPGYSVHVILTCDPTQEGKLMRRPDGDYIDINFYLELKSKYACAIKINGSTTTQSTPKSRKPTTKRVTPAFIGTAKTPVPPMFDVYTLGHMMIAVLILLSILAVLITLLIVQAFRRRKSYLI